MTNKYYYVEGKIYKRQEQTPDTCRGDCNLVERRIHDCQRPYANTRLVLACTICRSVEDNGENFSRWIK